jgi:intracellular sulfur oxidation DsrE/DsrF family protein
MAKSTTRRALLTHSLTGAAAAAAVSLTSTRVAAQAPARRFQPARHSQDEWLDTVPGKHRTFIDCASVGSAGSGMLYANNLYVANAKGYQLKEADVAVVVCLRHFATVFAFNDVIWAKYGQALSDAVSFVDSKTKQAPTKNLLDDPAYSQIPSSTISSVVKRGTHFAVCDMATNMLAGVVASSTKGVQEAVYTEFVRNLIPNSHLAAAGVVAVNRAQEYGYTLLTAV